ncbi:MAG: GMC oxidoreductase [Actinomycetota bacterium]|nr:GMC oxidoreductase [Actinomycetota bacterium]
MPFRVRFRTRSIRPDSEITLRSAAQGWDHDVAALYEGDDWIVELDEASHRDGLEFKFVLDRRDWMLGPNLRVEPVADADYVFDEAAVQFGGLRAGLDIVVENGTVAQRFFTPALADELFDVVVVGSGAGGGVLADQVSDLGLRVLVLEAGSYLFPTHVGNLPRQQAIGIFDKHVWRLWGQFAVSNYANEPGSSFAGGQGFNLGGRSIYWGGLTPRMAEWELDAWPPEIKSYLLSGGYARAEAIIGAGPVPASPYQEQTKTLLRNVLPEFTHADASMAVRYQGVTATSLAAGLFSTADLLMESRLTSGPVGGERLFVNLNHFAVRVETDGAEARVVARDLIADAERTFRGRAVVLSGGTIETARLALASGLDRLAGSAVGQGLTDHPIYYTHFGIPASSPQARDAASSKTISVRAPATAEHPYIMVLELGADFNQGRYVDEEILAAHRATKGKFTLCEIVFLFHAPLMDGNGVRAGGSPFEKVNVRVSHSDAATPHLDEVRDTSRKVIDALGGEPLVGDTTELKLAALGGVAHEVGTMRIGAVVDADLKVNGSDNLYVCDNSVFPVSPAANPTLTLVALADRLAGHLKQKAS